MDIRAENWKQGLDEGIFDTWPAQELFCIDEAWWATNSAEWQRKWAVAGGRLFEGRMIALKNDPQNGSGFAQRAPRGAAG